MKRTSNEENDIFEAMLAKYGIYELARKIARRKPYREYVQHWPFDHTESIVSLDVLHEAGYDPKGEDSPEGAYADAETVAEFIAQLTPRQTEIVEKLMKGHRPKDIYLEMGYVDTGGIRYHKWVLRHRWNEFKEATLYTINKENQ